MRRAALFTAALLCWLPAVAAAQDLDAVLDRLQDKAAHIATIQSRFVQEKHLSLFDAPVVSRGLFYYQRPDSMRFEYLEPARMGLVVDRGTARRITREGVSREGSRLAEIAAEQVMAWARFDRAALAERYQMALAGRNPVRLALIPRSAALARHIPRITVTFAQDERSVDSIRLDEDGGDHTLIRFTDTEINADLPDAAFK